LQTLDYGRLAALLPALLLLVWSILKKLTLVQFLALHCLRLFVVLEWLGRQ
jgi:hypothetical protein